MNQSCKICKKTYDNHNKFIMHLSYERRKEAVKTRAKVWAENNPEKRKVIIKQNNDRGKTRKAEWRTIKFYNRKIVRDFCRICLTRKKLVIHHVDGKNGKGHKALNNDPANLVILCKSCHPKTHNSHWLKDWRSL